MQPLVTAPYRNTDNGLEASVYQRFLLPGLSFKAVVIGGGYATGRELVEFFGSGGARDGLAGLAFSAVLWGVICALTFLYARHSGATDYQAFFQHLLGPFWPVFEVLLLILFVLILAVISAAAGEIFRTLLGLPPLVGQFFLIGAIATVVAFGASLVERVFKYTSAIVYIVFAALLLLTLTRFGNQLGVELSSSPVESSWFSAGLAFSGYNIVGAVLVLSVIRHLGSSRDAVVAGLLCGPLAILPGFAFFLCLIVVPEALSASLPSDVLLGKLGMPWFRVLYQVVIFLALLETGVGCIHSLNERAALAMERRGRSQTRVGRALIALMALMLAGFGAMQFGLVALIANGYRALSIGMLLVFVLPLLTIGVMRLSKAGFRSPNFEQPNQ